MVLRSRRPYSGPDRPEARRGRLPDGAGDAPPDPAARQLDEREMARVAAAGDPDPTGVSRPRAAAERPLAALEVPVRAGAEPDAAVGVHPDEGALPVVAVESGIRADPAQQVRPDPVRARQRRVGVRVVEPVLDVQPAAAPDDVGEGGGGRARRAPVAGRDVRVERGVVRSDGAAHTAALAPVHRELALARLVHEVGGERAHGGRGALAVRSHEPILVAVAAAGDRAHHVSRQEPAGVAPVETAPERQQRTESETAQRHECDELDARLAALPLHWLGSRPGMSLRRSTGLRQLLIIRSASP